MDGTIDSYAIQDTPSKAGSLLGKSPILRHRARNINQSMIDIKPTNHHLLTIGNTHVNSRGPSRQQLSIASDMPNIDLHTTINGSETQAHLRAKRSLGQGTMNTAATSIPSIKLKSNMRSKKVHSMVAEGIGKKIRGGKPHPIEERGGDADSIISKGNETTSS